MKNKSEKTGMKIGAIVGGLVFAVFGIVLAFFFESCFLLVLLRKLAPGMAEPAWFVRAALITGIVVGTSYVAVVSLVVGGFQRTCYIVWSAAGNFFVFIVAKIRNRAILVHALHGVVLYVIFEKGEKWRV